ncbi:estradiol 17-beta-dehydrogenase 8 [Rhipicephalus sanguineus]|uniref:(3R)-3-hydroxyacyl-CoA dehydrogenase n=1 Tax=Rhipicephalus sanguineus TaxID=34632 RepID=A0A9D4PYF2_RHISA|nr:estradiol 17-beta-dehydrogenase 8 [Rhipicephalus sanguineus]KAH7961056.1 hypothetical protein HPB52_001299 [Rhipicephalus sanguineus]
MSLRGRLAVVTGGASGIGKATCHVLAAQGASVVVADLNLRAAQAVAAELPDTATHRGVFVDVGDTTSVDKLFAEIKDTESLPVSILVNSAGIAKHSRLVDTTDEELDHVIGVNLKGTFVVSRAAARSMIASGVTDGAIVNLSSIAGVTGIAGMSAYTASKGGVVALTKAVAQELAPHGIRCNVVVPSLTETPMIGALPQEAQRTLIELTPLRRAGKPEEVAEAILFLCSPNSSFVTGAALDVMGGILP